jgi:hypothetical protein
MVKINLLDINEDRVILEKGSDLSIKDKPAKEEREFSLESVDELFKNSQPSKKPEPVIEAKPEKPKQPAPKKIERSTSTYSPQSGYKTNVNEEESFDHFPKGGKLLAVVVVVALIIAAALLYFFVFAQKGEDKEVPVVEAANEAQESDTSPTETTPQTKPDVKPGAKPELMSFYSQNNAKNNYNINLAQNLIKSSSGNVEIALMVLTGDQIQFSILADSKDALAGYQTTLKQKFSSAQLRLIDSYDMNVSGRMKVAADFTLSLKAPASGAQIANFRTIKSGDLQSTFEALAKKHRLGLQHFKKGKSVREGQFNQIKFYFTVLGNRDTIINFIKEATSSYPAISISKIALNPSGSSSFAARMNLILNEARMN